MSTARSRVGRPSGPSEGYAAQRNRILTAAAAVFARGGFDAASMRDVSEAAGLSVAALYHYFGSKDALMEGLIERAASGPRTGIAAASRRAGTLRELLYA